jgi:hypothetical protein
MHWQFALKYLAPWLSPSCMHCSNCAASMNVLCSCGVHQYVPEIAAGAAAPRAAYPMLTASPSAALTAQHIDITVSLWCCWLPWLQVLRRHELLTPSGSQPTLEVLELFGDMLLLKQPLAPFRIYNVGIPVATEHPVETNFTLLSQQCHGSSMALIHAAVDVK